MHASRRARIRGRGRASRRASDLLPESPERPAGFWDMTEPIRAYALLSDCQGAALVSRAGTVDWACFARFDAPSMFARLLGPDAGHFGLAPVGEFTTTRAYIEDTMVLRSVHSTATGSVAVTDALVLGSDESGHRIGMAVPHALVRVVEGLDGEVVMDVDVQPRPEYGLTVPHLVDHPGGALALGGSEQLVISSTAPLALTRGRAHARIRIGAGARAQFAVRSVSPWTGPAESWNGDEIDRRLAATIAGWRSWSGLHVRYDGAYAPLVAQSGRVLQALTYAPTGAIVAAATTSLPETPGGARNWDYRYCWVRDASLTMDALWVAACPHEASRFFDFIATATGTEVEPTGCGALQILYGIEGERHLPESELAHLEGYAGARPVRVGNGAWDQDQLDVYGELLNAACTVASQIGAFNESTRALLIDAADTAAQRWQERDRGIWEIRGEPRHFLYSKLMCWVALDRAIRLTDQLQAADRIERWARIREEIRTAIIDQGWNAAAGAFTGSFGSDALDASVLMMPIVGFLPASDPRVRATIEAVADRLTDANGMVYRYRADDGLDGDEGTFFICTFWLIHCMALLGDTVGARDLFERVTAHANDVGLLSEELDPSTGDLLGNFPQAFTHIGLVNAAWAITNAENSTAPRPPG